MFEDTSASGRECERMESAGGVRPRGACAPRRGRDAPPGANRATTGRRRPGARSSPRARGPGAAAPHHEGAGRPDRPPLLVKGAEATTRHENSFHIRQIGAHRPERRAPRAPSGLPPGVARSAKLAKRLMQDAHQVPPKVPFTDVTKIHSKSKTLCGPLVSKNRSTYRRRPLKSFAFKRVPSENYLFPGASSHPRPRAPLPGTPTP